ncbi:hypothetical protein [Propionicicella superfundia]|uniref:hypothetical protein n=1 Tax=Propionicicella superfundia TaxID=348582 RepID=UPI00048A9D70|nr:hypothetical protein [Propionicicella superfundia]
MLPMLPLETLPGWPEVDDPGIGAILLLTVALPLAISIPILLLTIGPTWFRQARADASGGSSGDEVAVGE